MQKGFAVFWLLLLIAFMIVLIVLFGVYSHPNKVAVSPLPTPPQGLNLPSLQPVEASSASTFKKYTDTDLRFSFTYPVDSFSEVSDSEAGFNKRENGNFRANFTGYVGYSPAPFVKAIAVIDPGLTPLQAFRDAPFSIWVFDNKDNLDSTQFYNRYWYYPFNWGQFDPVPKQKLAPSKQATVSGELVQFGIVPFQDGSPHYYYIPKDGRMFLIRVLSDNKQIGDQILSTLQFSQ